MSNRARWVMAAALAVTCALGSFVTVGAQESASALSLFKTGLQEYKAGEYEQATATFEKVLAMDPSLETALKMRELAALGMLVEMQSREGMDDVARRLLKLTTKAVRARKREVVNPEGLIADFQSADADDYLRAATVLKSHGPFAVPYLMPLLEMEAVNDSTTAVVGRTVAVLSDMHPDTCMPLIEVVTGTDNSLLLSRVVKVLGDLGDSRALPALVVVARNDKLLESVRNAAALAVQKIMRKAIETLDETDAVYLDLIRDYYNGVGTRVGFTYGFQGAIWGWDAEKKTVGYKLVPAYLYNDIMAVKLSLEALEMASSNEEIKAAMVSGLARQLGMVTFYSDPANITGEMADVDREDAVKRAERLNAHIPVVTALLEPSTVGRALEISVKAQDVPGSLIILDVLRTKLHALVPALPDDKTVGSLSIALESNFPPVRYESAIIFAETAPTAAVGPASQVIAVMSKAVRSASMRTALVIMNDLHERNTLATALHALDMGVIESRVAVTGVRGALDVMPAVDVVFVSGDAGLVALPDVLKFVGEDYRTSMLPLYVVVGEERAAEVAELSALSVRDLNVEALSPILKDTMAGPSKSAATPEEEALVLKGVKALTTIKADNTVYPLSMIEPSLISSLGAYSEEVSNAVIDCLAEFGSEMSLRPLADLMGAEVSAELKAASGDCIAAILKRTGITPTEPVMAALKKALTEGTQIEQEAAAAALSVAGLSNMDVLALYNTRAGEVMPAVAIDTSAIPAPSARTRLLKYAPRNVAAVVRVDIAQLGESPLGAMLRSVGGPAAMSEKATEFVTFLRVPGGALVDNPPFVTIVAFKDSNAAELGDLITAAGEAISIGDMKAVKIEDMGYLAVANDGHVVFASDEGLLQNVVSNIVKDEGSQLPRAVSDGFGTYRAAAVNFVAVLPDEYMERAKGKLPSSTSGLLRLAVGVFAGPEPEIRASGLYESEAAADLAVANFEGHVDYGQKLLKRMAAEAGDKGAVYEKVVTVLDKVKALAVIDIVTASLKLTEEDVQAAMEALMQSMAGEMAGKMEMIEVPAAE